MSSYLRIKDTAKPNRTLPALYQHGYTQALYSLYLVFSLEFTVKKAGFGGEKRKVSFTLGNSREGLVTTTGIITKVSHTKKIVIVFTAISSVTTMFSILLTKKFFIVHSNSST
jgi:hypothetical protein